MITLTPHSPGGLGLSVLPARRVEAAQAVDLSYSFHHLPRALQRQIEPSGILGIYACGVAASANVLLWLQTQASNSGAKFS